jgi:hypothetical protein
MPNVIVEPEEGGNLCRHGNVIELFHSIDPRALSC